MSARLLGSGSLLLVGLLFGLSGVIAKYLAGSMTAYQIVGGRFAFALVGAAALVALTGGLRLAGTRPLTLFAYAVSFPVSVILFTLAVVHGSVAQAVFTFYAATLISAFALGRVFFAEKLTPLKALALALTLLALLVMTGASLGEGGLAMLYGVSSGLAQGVASALQKHLSGLQHRASLLFVQCTAGVLAALVAVLLAGQSLVPRLSLGDVLIVAIFGLIMLAIAYLFLVGFKYTDLNTGSILVSSELLFGPALAYLLLDERISGAVLLGGALVAAAGICVNLPAAQPSEHAA